MTAGDPVPVGRRAFVVGTGAAALFGGATAGSAEAAPPLPRP